MTPRGFAITLVWLGAALLLGLLLFRLVGGAWSLDDDEVPPVSSRQKALAVVALIVTVLGTAIFIWDWL